MDINKCVYVYFARIGLIVSGSSDKIIYIWDVENAGDPIFSLIDHTDNVCALDITPSGYIVSGSWDKYVD